ncbi:MAG: thioredoxin domain-containing protein, partial [Nitrososphaerales archaeon]
LDFHLNPGFEIAVIGDPAADDTPLLLAEIWRRYLPNSVWALARPGDEAAAGLVPLLAGRPQLDGKATAYVCQNYVCRLPVTEAAGLAEQLEA